MLSFPLIAPTGFECRIISGHSGAFRVNQPPTGLVRNRISDARERAEADTIPGSGQAGTAPIPCVMASVLAHRGKWAS